MDQIHVQGGAPLHGTIAVSGATIRAAVAFGNVDGSGGSPSTTARNNSTAYRNDTARRCIIQSIGDPAAPQPKQ